MSVFEVCRIQGVWRVARPSEVIDCPAPGGQAVPTLSVIPIPYESREQAAQVAAELNSVVRDLVRLFAQPVERVAQG